MRPPEGASGTLAVQDLYAPENGCFGCGAANEKGLRIKSFPAARDPRSESPSDELVCEWMPEEHHQAYGQILNGGIIGALLDCHSNWTACCYLMRRDGLEKPPLTVTLDFYVKLKRPTSTDHPVYLRARPVPTDKKDRVIVEATLMSEGRLTATCTGTFVAVKPDHPAHQRH